MASGTTFIFERHQKISAHQDVISHCSYLTESLIVTSSHDKTVALWDAQNGEQKQQLCGHDHCVVACAIDQTFRTVLSGSWDKSIIYWDPETSNRLWVGNHTSQVTSCDLHSALSLAVSGCESGLLVCWDTRTGYEVKKIKGHKDTITSCKFSHDGLKMCTTSMDSTAYVWDVGYSKPLLTFNDHTNTVTSCTFTKTDSYLVTTSWDKTIRIYDVKTGSYRSGGPLVLKHDGCINDCAFSSDDRLLLTCGFDKTISMWDMHTCSIKKHYKGHRSWIYCCEFSPSDKWFISGSKDGELGVWNIELDYEEEERRRESFVAEYRRQSIQCHKCGLPCPVGSGCDEDNLTCVFCRLK